MEKMDILSMRLSELEPFIENMGEKKFRAKQIFNWLHKRGAVSFDEMTDISKNFREKLKDKAKIQSAVIADKFISNEDNTTKYLFEVENNYIIESVLMRYEYGNAVCISSQAGCRMGCSFCASAIGGLERSLTAGEMVSQIYEIQKDSRERVSNVVIMGSGEPLDNFENVLRFIELINSKYGLEIGQRHITLSTCGLADMIYRLAEFEFQITLAVSLHAPNDSIRKKIMPVANKYSIEDIISSAKDYARRTKRRVTYEYALINGVNDDLSCARELALRLKGSLCHVNLIPINDVKERDYMRSSDRTIKAFADALKSMNIETTIRRRLGSDINAACGQLRKSYKTREND